MSPLNGFLQDEDLEPCPTHRKNVCQVGGYYCYDSTGEQISRGKELKANWERNRRVVWLQSTCVATTGSFCHPYALRPSVDLYTRAGHMGEMHHDLCFGKRTAPILQPLALA